MTSTRPNPSFRRSPKWRFQTKPLPAEIAGPVLLSRLGNRSSSLPEGSLTSRLAAPNAAQPVRASSQVPEVSAGQHEKCIQSSALSVGSRPRSPLGPVVTGQSTVAIVSAGWDQVVAARSQQRSSEEKPPSWAAFLLSEFGGIPCSPSNSNFGEWPPLINKKSLPGTHRPYLCRSVGTLVAAS